MAEWAFRVRVCDVSTKHLVCTDRPAESSPYVRVDFDGKVLSTEASKSIGDPSWSYRASFEYRLIEPDLAAVMSSLCARVVTFTVIYTDGTKHVAAGRASVDLFTVATGASSFQLPIYGVDSNNATTTAATASSSCGVLYLTMQMEQLSSVGVKVARINVHGLPAALSTRLSASLLSDGNATGVEGPVCTSTCDPTWCNLPPIIIRASTRSILENVLRLHVREVPSGAFLGVVDIPMREIITTVANHCSSIKKNLYSDSSYPTPFTALVTGVIEVVDLPALAQLESGLYTKSGVHGKPLLPTSVLPPRYSRHSKSLHDIERPQQPLSPNERPTGMVTGDATANSWIQHAISANQDPKYKTPMKRVLGDNAGPSNPSRISNAAVSPSRAWPETNVLHHSRQIEPSRHFEQSHMDTNLARAKSPLRGAGNALISQHEDAAAVIDQQQRRIDAAMMDLKNRTERERNESTARLAALEMDERVTSERFNNMINQVKELQTLYESTNAQAVSDASSINLERQQLTQELEELTELESKLTGLLMSIQAHAEEDARQIQESQRQVQAAKTRLEHDTTALFGVEARIAPVVHSPLRNRNLSMTSNERPMPPGNSLQDLITHGDAVLFDRMVNQQPNSIFMDHTLLLQACGQPSPQVNIARTILRHRPELVNVVDPTTGNTALHMACNSVRPSSELVELLINHGANCTAFNAEGLSPFHVALLNSNDALNLTRKTLLMKGPGASVEQRTARGETPCHLLATHDRHLEALRFLGDNGSSMKVLAPVTSGRSVTMMTALQKARLYSPASAGIIAYLEIVG